jgi:asparagine synthase (glutamine-hydrolysing)
MCGIAGILNYSESIAKPALLQQMLDQIDYRGPDESGIYIGKYVGLGNVRLSIIDLTSGQQPMTTINEDLWIVFNGEIFNYIELKEELINLGYQFRTNCDTEVLLLLFKHYREKCLTKLNGQFAFAIWDNQEKELFLARDRVGIRPLFYARVNNTFVFGSEIKCLLEYNGIKPEIDLESLNQVFTFWTTLTPNTVFKKIYELPPGNYLKINQQQTIKKQYWKLEFPSIDSLNSSMNLDDALCQFEELLTDAVKLRLRSDVQVAAYLSGGIDSSATSYFIKKIEPGVLNTYSIGFTDSEFDETLYQQEVSRWLKTLHVAFECRSEDIATFFPKVLWHSEIPLLRTGPVPMFLLSKNVHQNGIKVVITGEGADEMLTGYNIFKEAIIREFWAKEPGSKYRPLLLQKLYPYLDQFQGRKRNMLKFFFGYKLQETSSAIYSHMVRWKNSEHVKAYFSNDVKNLLTNSDPFSGLDACLPRDIGKWDLLSRAQWIETSIFMSGYLLSSQGDRMAMANSVEGRYPFLDHRLIDFCSKLPGKFKLNGLTEKYLLKQLMYSKLPERVIKRPKQAYRAPVAKSFISNSSPEYVKELLSEKRVNEMGIFNYGLIKKLVSKIDSGNLPTEIDNMALAGILSTHLLHDIFVNGNNHYRDHKLSSNCQIIYDKVFQHKP